MAEYLKKKKLYELTKQLLTEDKLPLMKECKYKFYHGAEWLYFSVDDGTHYKISSLYCGKWIEIEKKGYLEPDGELVILQRDIYADLKNGVYNYHSTRENKHKTKEGDREHHGR